MAKTFCTPSSLIQNLRFAKNWSKMTNLSGWSKKTLPRIGGRPPVPSLSIFPTERRVQRCTSAQMIYTYVGAECKESCRTAGAGVCWDVGLGAVARCKVHGGTVARCKEHSQTFQVGHRLLLLFSDCTLRIMILKQGKRC